MTFSRACHFHGDNGTMVCKMPPAGWWCSRDKGHGGPCAARPAPSTLYRVNVKGGGKFLYDLADVGRFAQRMAAEGDERAFSITEATEDA